MSFTQSFNYAGVDILSDGETLLAAYPNGEIEVGEAVVIIDHDAYLGEEPFRSCLLATPQGVETYGPTGMRLGRMLVAPHERLAVTQA